MKKLLVALIVSATVLAATPAAADHTYIGTAEATALELSIIPPGAAEDERQGVLIGNAHSVVTSTGAPDEGCEAEACASGTVVGPVGEPTVRVEASDEPARDQASEGELPPELSPLLDAQFGVVEVEAAPPPGPHASASAEGANIDVNVLSTIIDNLPQPVTDAVDQVADPLTDALGEVLGNTPQEVQDIAAEVDELLMTLDDTLRQNPAVDVDVQDSVAAAADSPQGQPELEGVTVAEATANGATVALLPGTPVAPDGLFRVEVGQATARATTDQQTATISSQGAIATVYVADLTTTDDGDYQEVPLESGQEEQCVGQTPLLLCVLVGGSSEQAEGAAAAAVAGAVQIRAFADAEQSDQASQQNPLPGITLKLATAEVGVNAAAPGATTPPADDPDTPSDTPQQELPSTGGGLMVPGIALLAVGTAAAFALHRRRD